MTTQRQLLDLATKHEANPAVHALLTSLKDAAVGAYSSLENVESLAKTLSKAVKITDGYHVPISHVDLVTKAAEACASMARMASDFVSLACILESLGEDVSY